MKESDIMHENGKFWVMKDKHKNKLCFTIMKNCLTHSESQDGASYVDLSIAIARCDYLAKREVQNAIN